MITFLTFGMYREPVTRSIKPAMQVLAVPASSAPVERIFSTGGMMMRPHCSRLSSANLEMLVSLKCNHSLYFDFGLVRHACCDCHSSPSVLLR